MNKYDEIINLPHWEPKNHKRMSIKNRAAQFAPYSALSGYEDEVEEAGKIKINKKELSEDQKTIIDMKLNIIDEHIKENKLVSILYITKDKTKKDIKYANYKGIVRRIDKVNKEIIFKDESSIKIDSIIDINIDNIERREYLE